MLWAQYTNLILSMVVLGSTLAYTCNISYVFLYMPKSSSNNSHLGQDTLEAVVGENLSLMAPHVLLV